MEMLQTNSYLLVTLSRSIDSSHFGKSIHMVGSVFHTTYYDFESLVPRVGKKYMILRLTFDTDLDRIEFRRLDSSESVIEITLNVTVFFEIYSALGYPYLDNFLKYLVKEQGRLDPKDRELLQLENILSDTLFVFEELNWFGLQTLSKLFNIDISGGTISKRHVLSTSQYNLSNYLIVLGYTEHDVYNSYINLRKLSLIEKKANEDLLNFRLYVINKDLMLTHLNNYFTKKIDVLTKDISNLESNINIKGHNINSLKAVLSKKISVKESKQKNVDTKRILKIKDNITNLGNVITKNQQEISLIKSKLLEINLEKEGLNNLSYEDLRNKYFSYCHNNLVREQVNKFKTGLLRLNNKIVKPKSSRDSNYITKRQYNTLSNINGSIFTKNNLLLNKNVLNYSNYKLNLSYKNFIFRRSLSIYPNSSIFNDNLMKFIFSGKTKEQIQKDIEVYLFSQQNLVVLDQISDSNLNYKLLNSKVTKVLLESKIELNKLYNNYTSGISSIKSQSSDNIDYKLVLSTVGFEYLLNIMLGRLFKIMSDKTRHSKFYTEVAFDLGKDTVNRYNFNIYLQNRSNLEINSFILFKEKYPALIIISEDPTIFVEIGNILLGFLLELKLVSFKVEIFENYEKKRILHVGEKLQSSISNEKLPVINIPKKTPMLIPPKKYLDESGNVRLGGFLLNDELYTEPLIIEKPNLAEKTKVSDKNIIYKMVDNINSVSFSVNQEVLNFILKNYKKYNLILDPDYKHPLESKTKITLDEKRELESFNSRKYLEGNILNLALIYSNCSEFFIPVRLDYRGRIYCSVEYFHYQSIDLARALLCFSKGELVNITDELSINYLKIFGANCFGNKLEKKSFFGRLNWVQENEIDIINFDNGNLISKADNKLLFIAFCFEYRKYIEALRNNEDCFITHLPIQFDATCNGFQHLSLLLAENSLATQVNLNPSTWKDNPNDFYSFLTLSCKEFFNSELVNNNQLDNKTKESYERLCNVDYQSHRNLVKKTIMTIPYSSTIYANINDMKAEFNLVKKQNEKFFIYKKDQNIIFKDIDFANICNTLYICLNRNFPKLKALLQYFKEIARVSNKLSLSIPWTLPSGLVVIQKYYGTKTIKLKPFIYTKDVLNLNVLDKTKYDVRKQYRALMPNLVHSLDAASLALLIDIYFKKDTTNNFYSIHDCFAVTCNKVNYMVQLLKLSYCEIYCKESFLRKFDNNFKQTISIHLGKDCFLDKNTIQIINDKGETIKIKYPDVEQVIKPSKIEFKKGSYIIN